MIHHFAALALTLAAYLLLAVAYYGWGRAAAWALRIRGATSVSPAWAIWLGWAATLLVFQVLHFFLPLTAYVVIPIFAVGIIFSLPHISFASQHSLVSRLVFISGVILLASWVASRSMLPPENGDSSMYHFNAIRWINSFPIVPGLGNLHGRLAFNESFFTYVAALNVYPLLGYGRGLANSFLFLLLLVDMLYCLAPALKHPRLFVESHPFLHLFDLFALPILGFVALSSDGFASPTPDLACIILQLALFRMLARGVAGRLAGAGQQEFAAAVLVIVAATAITIKLSNFAFALALISICVWYARPAAMRALPPAVLILGVWCLRGIILSGCPAYPSSLGRIAADWAIPLERVNIMAHWIRSWARTPMAHWSGVLGNWDWLGPWFSRVLQNTCGAAYPLKASAVFCGLTLGTRCWLGSRRRYGGCVILLPVVAGLGFWFFTAPDPRFAHALPWLLALSLALLWVSSLHAALGARAFGAAVVCSFVALNSMFLLNFVRHRDVLKQVSRSGWYPVPTAEVIERKTASGLVVYMPKNPAVGLWDSPLPATFYFDPYLRLRIPGEPAAGFATETRPGEALEDGFWARDKAEFLRLGGSE